MAAEETSLTFRLGETLRRLRNEAGLSQEDLADESRLHPNYIGMIERGERKITIVAATRIARSLGTRLSQVLILLGE